MTLDAPNSVPMVQKGISFGIGLIGAVVGKTRRGEVVSAFCGELGGE